MMGLSKPEVKVLYFLAALAFLTSFSVSASSVEYRAEVENKLKDANEEVDRYLEAGVSPASRECYNGMCVWSDGITPWTRMHAAAGIAFAMVAIENATSWVVGETGAPQTSMGVADFETVRDIVWMDPYGFKSGEWCEARIAEGELLLECVQSPVDVVLAQYLYMMEQLKLKQEEFNLSDEEVTDIGAYLKTYMDFLSQKPLCSDPNDPVEMVIRESCNDFASIKGVEFGKRTMKERSAPGTLWWLTANESNIQSLGNRELSECLGMMYDYQDYYLDQILGDEDTLNMAKAQYFYTMESVRQRHEENVTDETYDLSSLELANLEANLQTFLNLTVEEANSPLCTSSSSDHEQEEEEEEEEDTAAMVFRLSQDNDQLSEDGMYENATLTVRDVQDPLAILFQQFC